MKRILILVGSVLVIIELILQYKIKIPYVGKLPGDFAINNELVSFYFPITSSLIISAILILIIYFIGKNR